MTKFVLPLLVGVALAQGIELRAPTPAERQALDRISGAINKVFDQFNSPDWTLDEDRSHDDLMVNGSDSGRPLDVNSDFHRGYVVNDDSERAQKLLMPFVKEAQAADAAGDTDKELAIGQKVADLRFLSMEAHVNLSVLDVPADANPHAADVRGAALVYKLDEDACKWADDSRGPCWVLAFGDWQHATHVNGDEALSFHFTHKDLTPFVETVVIHMRGAEDRIKEMLQKADRPALVAGLTR